MTVDCLASESAFLELSTFSVVLVGLDFVLLVFGFVLAGLDWVATFEPAVLTVDCG